MAKEHVGRAVGLNENEFQQTLQQNDLVQLYWFCAEGEDLDLPLPHQGHVVVVFVISQFQSNDQLS